jgi:hypothetical protein
MHKNKEISMTVVVETLFMWKKTISATACTRRPAAESMGGGRFLISKAMATDSWS